MSDTQSAQKGTERQSRGQPRICASASPFVKAGGGTNLVASQDKESV